MLEILWSFFTIIFFIGVIYFCVMATRYIRRKLGLGAAVIFVIWLMSSNGGNVDKSKSSPKLLGFQPDTGKIIIAKTFQSIVLEENPLYKINLLYHYGFHKNTNHVLAVSAFSTATGFLSGVRWLPGSIIMIPDSSGTKLHYSVSGTLERRLLNIYQNAKGKIYEGTLDVSGSSPIMLTGNQ